jgi:hypothetical protein
MAWSRKLTPPLMPKGGCALTTLSDARDMILGLPEGRRRARYWRHAAELLIYATENEKEAIDDVRAQLMRPLYRDRYMWGSARPDDHRRGRSWPINLIISQAKAKASRPRKSVTAKTARAP